MPKIVEMYVGETILFEYVLELNKHILTRHWLPQGVGENKIVFHPAVSHYTSLDFQLASMGSQSVQTPDLFFL